VVIILTNSDDATSDFLCERLDRHGAKYCRLNTDTFTHDCQIDYVSGIPYLTFESERFCSTEVQNLWLRRPKSLQCVELKSPEALHAASEWMEALEGFLAHISFDRWINHPSANAGASHKLEQLTRARRIGLLVPDTLLTQSPEAVRQFWTKHKHHIVVKPLSGGYIEHQGQKEDTVIYTSSVSEEAIKNVELICECPTLFQERINKAVDIRVCYLDGVATAVELVALENGQQRLDIRRDNMRDVNYRVLKMPTDVEVMLVKLLRSYNLRFAAVDFVIDREGNWVFLEINPNGQWAWLDLESDANIAEHFIQILKTI
jgi:hypothetical protein